jgi:uncharacterized protein
MRSKNLLLFLLLIILVPLAFSKIIIVGVNTALGSGITSPLDVELKPGSGNIYFTQDKSEIGRTFIREARESVEAASTVLGKNLLEKYDVYFKFKIDSPSIDGPSAGAAMALGTILAYKHIDLNHDYCITGAISQDGKILPVGAVDLKAKVCMLNGYKYFFVPYGELSPDMINKNIKIYEVKDLNELYSKIMELEGKPDSLNLPPEYKPEKFPYAFDNKFLEEYLKLKEKYLKLKSDVEKLKDEVNYYYLVDTRIKLSEYYYKEAQKYFEYRYMYPALNSMFHAIYQISVGKIILESPSVLKKNTIIYNKYKKELQDLYKKWDDDFKTLPKYSENLDYLIAAQLRWSWAHSRFKDFSVDVYILSNLWYDVYKLFKNLSGKQTNYDINEDKILEETKIEYENYKTIVGIDSSYEVSSNFCENQNLKLCSAANYIYSAAELYPMTIKYDANSMEKFINKILSYTPKTKYSKLMYSGAYLYAKEAKYYLDNNYPYVAKKDLSEAMTFYYIAKKFDEYFYFEKKNHTTHSNKNIIDEIFEVITEIINNIFKLIHLS